jgi:hypothetical protein
MQYKVENASKIKKSQIKWRDETSEHIYQHLTLKSDMLSHNSIHTYQTTSPWSPEMVAEPFIRVVMNLTLGYSFVALGQSQHESKAAQPIRR